MNINTGAIGIIADDLTGANDTALQFHLRGCNTQILFDYSTLPEGQVNTQAWAISTETRNKDPQDAKIAAEKAAKMFKNELGVEYLYKKIDSTLRGNIGVEALSIIESNDMDAAVIVPAFPTEGRTTVGGYHLLKGIPIERTEIARDPSAPIYKSHIPALLASQIDNPELIDVVDLNTVINGAGPILMKMQELIKSGKKLIVVDAVSTVDIEQIALALNKCTFNVLSCGSAGLAQAMAKYWLPEMKHQHISKVIPKMPIFAVSGSTTKLTSSQIKKSLDDDELEPYSIYLTPEMVLAEPTEELVDRIVSNFGEDKVVIVYSTDLTEDYSKTVDYAVEQGFNPDNVPNIISNYLADLTREVTQKAQVILVLMGGETSYKCCNEMNSKHLQIIDEVEPAIPLCLDHKAQWIVTKSGNLGTVNTLLNIFKYFKQHQ